MERFLNNRNAANHGSFLEINASVVSKVPKIPLYIPILHCAIAYASYIAIIQFLLALAKEKAIPITLFMAYCAMESGSFHIIFGSYSVFRGAFNAQDYYHMFPQNIMCMAITMPVLYTVVYFLNKKDRRSVISNANTPQSHTCRLYID